MFEKIELDPNTYNLKKFTIRRAWYRTNNNEESKGIFIILKSTGYFISLPNFLTNPMK